MRCVCLALLNLLLAASLGAAHAWAFPLEIKGQTLSVSPDTGKDSLTQALAQALSPQEPSVATNRRLQYDYIAVDGQAPVTVLFDFDAKGRLSGVQIDAFTKKQNPPAQRLAAWLTAQAGPGKKSGTSTRWTVEGFLFRLKEVKNAGEDSTYGFEITRK